jgi:hypothetical protein
MAQKDVDDIINIVIYVADLVGNVAKNIKRLLTIYRRRTRTTKQSIKTETMVDEPP